MSYIVGIVAEFNPFHNGHKYLIEKVREKYKDSTIVAVMSGNFIQRGGPAYFDKWHRAKKALENDVDLVIELPTVFACSSSGYFASAGVFILEELGCDIIAFGSESGDVSILKTIASKIASNEEIIKKGISLEIKKGNSYPIAREKVLAGILDEKQLEVIRGSNNILALEYIMSNKNMEVFTVARDFDGHHESGQKIRNRLMKSNPDYYKAMEEKYFLMVMSRVFSMTKETIFEISADEGLASKAVKVCRMASNLDELVMLIKSKAYTYSRISRLLNQIVLNIPANLPKEKPRYVRILALNKSGGVVIKNYEKKKSEKFVKIISNINKVDALDEIGKKQLAVDIKAADCYNLIVGNDLYKDSDFVKKPHYLSES